jgi:co-chaperonin GroES (HSP10)
MIPASKLDEAFPPVEPGVYPKGTRVLVQLRTVRSTTQSGLVIVEETKQFNKGNTQLAKVVYLGPIAYCNRETGQRWPEGTWVKPGDYVRIPKFGGDRFERQIAGSEDTVIFAIFQDHEIIAQVDPDAFEAIDEIL